MPRKYSNLAEGLTPARRTDQNIKRSMAPSPRKVCLKFSRNGLLTRKFLPILILCLLLSCGTQGPEEKILEVRISEVGVESKAVSEILPLVSASHLPEAQQLSPAQQSLFTYLAKMDPADLVTTKAHSQGIWRIEKVYILDDSVAVQMSEGHYLETLFFVQYSKGWRLKSRITPSDHKYEGKG